MERKRKAIKEMSGRREEEQSRDCGEGESSRDNDNARFTVQIDPSCHCIVLLFSPSTRPFGHYHLHLAYTAGDHHAGRPPAPRLDLPFFLTALSARVEQDLHR